MNSSISWPNMFDVARNTVNLYTDQQSVTNRVKLLLLTEPTELYMNPNFGVGLKKYLFKYNNDNTIAMIRDELIAQLKLWEPNVLADETTITRNPSSLGNDVTSVSEAMNELNLTVTLKTAQMDTVSFGVSSADLVS